VEDRLNPEGRIKPKRLESQTRRETKSIPGIFRCTGGAGLAEDSDSKKKRRIKSFLK